MKHEEGRGNDWGILYGGTSATTVGLPVVPLAPLGALGTAAHTHKKTDATDAGLFRTAVDSPLPPFRRSPSSHIVTVPGFKLR